MTTAQDRARNRRIGTCYDRLACDFLTTHMYRRDNRLGVPLICCPPRSPMTGLDEDKLALSGSPSQNFGSGDGLTLSCEIDGRFASEYVIAVNCDGNRIAAGKRQFKRLVEMGVDPIVFLTFRGGARSLRV